MTWVSLKQHSTAVGPSPIAMMISDERTNRILGEIADQLDAMRAADSSGEPPPQLILSRKEMTYVRQCWEQNVLQGEQWLYGLATLLAYKLTATQKIQRVARVVAGPKEEYETEDARIVIEEILSTNQLKHTTDYGLSEALTSRYRYRPPDSADYGSLYARASFLEFRPLEIGEKATATRVITRVKANDSIWNKVCDAFFDIDQVVARDKILNPKGKYVKDVFGIKILTAHKSDSYRVEEQLQNSQIGKAINGELGISEIPDELELIERKDYIASGAQRKNTGWEAIKNVYRWGSHFFEIQIQTEANYFAEISDLSSTSHRTFEMQRRHLRWALEKRLPHYREFRHLLRGIFDSRPGSTRLEALDINLDWVQLVD